MSVHTMRNIKQGERNTKKKGSTWFTVSCE